MAPRRLARYQASTGVWPGGGAVFGRVAMEVLGAGRFLPRVGGCMPWPGLPGPRIRPRGVSSPGLRCAPMASDRDRLPPIIRRSSKLLVVVQRLDESEPEIPRWLRRSDHRRRLRRRYRLPARWRFRSRRRSLRRPHRRSGHRQSRPPRTCERLTRRLPVGDVPACPSRSDGRAQIGHAFQNRPGRSRQSTFGAI